MVAKVVSLLSVLLAVAFFTLLDRKVLALTAGRLGVNKVVLAGVVQPLMDAFKLLSKSLLLPYKSFVFLVFIAPFSFFLLSLLFWDLLLDYCSSSPLLTGFMLVLLVSLQVFPKLLTGWVSSSKYSVLGALRACCLGVSVEVVLSLMLFCIFIWEEDLVISKHILMVSFLFFPLWLMLMLVDTSIPPFDLTEAESELVSGFNTEHGSSTFVFLFLAEYGMKLVMSALTSVLFLGGSSTGLVIVFFLLLLSHAAFPRVKIDWLSGFMWWKLLPGLVAVLCLLWVFL